MILCVLFRKMGNPSDADWFGADNNKYKLTKAGRSNLAFRTTGERRGSNKNLQLAPKPYDHKSSSDEPSVNLDVLMVNQKYCFYFRVVAILFVLSLIQNQEGLSQFVNTINFSVSTIGKSK